ncbi:ArsR/SmtB family transcription factor [Methanothrix harundinacea]|uniref:Transcriptional regulator, ArsR family n=1 Tax=Methanothrix harundinacea (strain 6Ac) TaxID=1110509 RepID=G7WP74_METH6|nr:metalloregulator ArsR/SmtB family transcription factor [Methanothrix harundinacea]AET64915.1 Transcriptional regulator, ArsR family [Methanothrix harundinacea 6Ac]
MAEVFKAMADPFRLAILKLLRDNELCVCEINLSILKRQALVKDRKEGKWSRYCLSEGAVIEMMMKLADLMMGDGWLPKRRSGCRHT